VGFLAFLPGREPPAYAKIPGHSLFPHARALYSWHTFNQASTQNLLTINLALRASIKLINMIHGFK